MIPVMTTRLLKCVDANCNVSNVWVMQCFAAAKQNIRELNRVKRHSNISMSSRVQLILLLAVLMRGKRLKLAHERIMFSIERSQVILLGLI